MRRRALDVLAFMDELPLLCPGELAGCSLGVSTNADHFVCVARLRQAPPDPTRRRLEFWAWQLGGSATFAAGAWDPSPARPEALRPCDHVAEAVGPEALSETARTLLGRFLGASADLSPGRLLLTLALGTPEAAGITFDRRAQSVFVPSPRRPPLGDAITLRLRAPGGEEVSADGVVSQHRAAGQDAPGSPAGFVLGLPGGDGHVVSVLLRHLRGGVDQRRAPRYPATLRATVSAVDERPQRVVPPGPAPRGGGVSYVENVSQGGAFVRTEAPLPPGTKVRVDLGLAGEAGGIPGTVVHAAGDGLGIRFEVDRAGEAAIDSALERVAVQRRRALVVGHDHAARRLLEEALAARGFEVFAVADGSDGLRKLIDLLLDLDLLVVDVDLPGLDGASVLEVIRDGDGARGLAIVAMASSVDERIEARLVAAGADAVLAKTPGATALAGAAVRAMLHRERATEHGIPARPRRRDAARR